MIKLPSIPSGRSETVNLNLSKFNGGVISLLDEARLPMNAARQATNMMQVQDGLWSPRWGSKTYTTAGASTVSGASVGGAARALGFEHEAISVGVYRSGVPWQWGLGGRLQPR